MKRLCKMVCICFCVLVCGLVWNEPIYAKGVSAQVEPRMTSISSYSTELTISSDGIASVTGFVRGKSGVTSTYVKVTLQQKVSGVENILDGFPVSSQNNAGQYPNISAELPQFTPNASEELPQSILEVNSSQQEISFSEEEKNSTLLSEESYRAILLGDKDFIHSSRDGEYQEMVNIGDIKATFTASEDIIGAVTKFAIVDMDGDGKNEIVLWIQTQILDEGFEILHYQEGEVYGYHFWARALEQLKADGTFISSDGAFDTSIQKIVFLEKGCTVDTLYQSESVGYNPDGIFEIKYHADDEICSKEEFNEVLSHQNEKPDVEWYELTTENIAIFENIF